MNWSTSCATSEKVDAIQRNPLQLCDECVRVSRLPLFDRCRKLGHTEAPILAGLLDVRAIAPAAASKRSARLTEEAQ
jgi:hypothetical protein